MTSLETSSPAVAEARVAETAQSLREMAAVVRVLFGVGLQRSANSAPEPLSSPVPEPMTPPMTPPTASSSSPAPTSVPASIPVPTTPPHDAPAPRPAAITGVPLPEAIPVGAVALPTEAPAAIPVPGLAPQQQHQHSEHDLEPERRSLAMLNEIAFLDD